MTQLSNLPSVLLKQLTDAFDEALRAELDRRCWRANVVNDHALHSASVFELRLEITYFHCLLVIQIVNI